MLLSIHLYHISLHHAGENLVMFFVLINKWFLETDHSPFHKYDFLELLTTELVVIAFSVQLHSVYNCIQCTAVVNIEMPLPSEPPSCTHQLIMQTHFSCKIV